MPEPTGSPRRLSQTVFSVPSRTSPLPRTVIADPRGGQYLIGCDCPAGALARVCHHVRSVAMTLVTGGEAMASGAGLVTRAHWASTYSPAVA